MGKLLGLLVAKGGQLATGRLESMVDDQGTWRAVNFALLGEN
jgi:hypothetical protein